MKRLFLVMASASLILSGCAQKADKIAPSYVSPLTYQDYSCKQIAAEAGRVSNRAAEITGVQNKQAQNDAVATGVALVLFWPAAFFIKGDKQTGAELARLKGELETLESISIQKNCGIEFRRAPSQETESLKI